MNILSIGGIISPSQQLVIDTLRPDLYRAHSSDSSSSRRDTNLSSVRTAMLRGQLMLIETLLAECRLDHSGSFVHGMASV